MRFAIVEQGVVVNVALADSPLFGNWIPDAFAGPGWLLTDGLLAKPAVAAAPVPTVYTKMAKRSFFARFPKNADGVSTKFSLITLFLIDDGYASSLGVTGATLYGLRALIITGKNAIDNSLFIDFTVSDAAAFTYLMMQASIPAPFRLTALERSAIMDVAITEAEAYK